MKNSNDGGPAFPTLDTTAQHFGEPSGPGMSLRAYIATKAVVGLFAQCAHPESPGIAAKDYAAMTADAVRIADALIAALNTEQPQ